MSLVIGGFQPFSTVDYPGKLAAVVFLQGCPWRCPYCHNKALQPFDQQPDAPAWESILEVLKERRGQLDAVVFSGGEPTSQWIELNRAIDDVLDMDFVVGLHTSGSYFLGMKSIGSRCDWVGFDYKSPITKYDNATGTIRGRYNIKESLRSVLETAKAVEVRTTWDSTLLSIDDSIIMAREISECGAPSWTIQRCTGDQTDLEMVAEAARLAKTGMKIKVRG